MAVKRYPVQYVKKYKYQPDDGETEDITFMANGYIFPLFKSYTGEELGVALDDYRKGMLEEAVNEDTVKLIAKYDAAQDYETKEKLILENPSLVTYMVKAAMNAADVKEGLSLIDALLIVSHVCALPEDEHAEALALGTELLPEEIYQDPMFAFEILDMAFKYSDHVKKNSNLKMGNRTTH